MELKHENACINHINLHYVSQGSGPLVILLHGFPQYWYTWRHQISFLSQYFKVVALDLRGYGDSEKPPKIEDYRLEELATDVKELIYHLGYSKAHLIGHDWGGAIAWFMAARHPVVIDHLIVLNSPYPSIFKKALKTNLKQLMKSWYIFFFQIPYVPEVILKSFSKSMLANFFRSSSVNKETFSNDDIEMYYENLQKPGVLKSAINYYRAIFQSSSQSHGQVQIDIPTLLIWGERDVALTKELTLGMERYFKQPIRIRYLPEAGHWVNEEVPDKINALILEFLNP